MSALARRAARFAAAALLLAAAGAWLSGGARAQNPAPGPTLEQLAEKARIAGSARVLLEMRVGAGPGTVEQRKAEIRAAQQRAMSALAGRTVKDLHQYEHLPFIAADLDEGALRAAAAHPSVVAVHEDALSAPMLLQSGPLIGTSTDTGPAPDDGGAYGRGYTGTGQHVAILDTGVERNHPFLKQPGGAISKVVYEACFSTTSSANGGSVSACPNGQSEQAGAVGAAAPCSPASCRHGTHVAGIAAGNGANASPAQAFSGVARDASIIALQVFSVFGSASVCGSAGAPCALSYNSDQLKALEHLYAIRGSYSIASANMSLGGGQFSANCDANILKPAIDLLRGARIATVIASGNDGFSSSISAPACISSAVSVGSTTKQDAVSSFSNSASMLHLLAPGSSINASILQGQYGTLSGTSMATPHVAGALAVLKQKSPNASVSELLGALSATGLPVTDARNGLVKPRIRLDRALDALASSGPALVVSPADGLFATGTAGGPFAPLSKVFQLTNSGTAAVDFTVATSVPWATVSPTSGSISPGGPAANFTVRIAGNAASLAAGIYGGAVNFTATNGAGSTSRALGLTVLPPAPLNDKFQDGIVLSASSGGTSGTNAGASRDAGEPSHAGLAGGASVWWRWTAPSNGQLTVDTFGSGFDTVLAAYTGSSIASLTPVASNNNTSGTRSQISFPAIAGVTYHIAVDGAGSPAATGAVALNWIFGDHVQPGDVTVTPETGFAPSGGLSGPFSPASITYTLTNASAGTRNYVVAGMPAWLTASSTSGSIPVGESRTVTLSVNLFASTLPAGAHTGTVMFNSTPRAVTLTVIGGGGSNDAFTNAAALSGNAVTATGSNVTATGEPGEPSHAGVPPIHSVWWRWTSPVNQAVTIDTAGSSFDTVLAVYTGNAVSSLNPVASNDDAIGLQSAVTFNATAGTEYRIAVDGYFGAFGAITLHINGAAGSGGPANDAFANAATLAGTSVAATGSNVGATEESGEPDHAGNPGGASVWWRWTAPATQQVTIDTVGSTGAGGFPLDTLLAVYTGSTVSNLTLVAANDDIDFNGGVYQSRVTFQAVQGTTYRIAVDGYNLNDGFGAETGAIALNLAVAGSVPTGTHALLYFSQPGDYIGQGQTGNINGAQFVSATGNFQNGVTVRVNDGANNWTVDFGGPLDSAGSRPRIGVGAYENAVRFPFNNGLSPGLSMSGNGRGCNTLKGRFDVLDAAFGAGGEVLRFAADFAQHCEGGAPALFGQVRFNSSVPLDFQSALPSPFAFAPAVDAPRSTQVTSSPVAIGGPFSSAPIRVSGGEYSINGGPFTSTAGTLANGQFVTLRVMAASTAGTQTYATVRIGAASATFQATTAIGQGANVLYFKSQPGDFIGGGAERLLYAGTGYAVGTPSRNSQGGVSFNISGTGASWDLQLSSLGLLPAPALVPGAYESARRFPFNTAGYPQPSTPAAPGLNFSGDGRGCNMLTGRFDVLEATYGGGGVVQSFAANFEQSCEGTMPPLFGRIRYNSSFPLFSAAGKLRDFDGGGRSDILWKHAPTGQTYTWQMNGTALASTGAPASVGNEGWAVVGIGDFDGDGKADILWRHPNGTVLVWLMNGPAIAGTGSPANVDPGWQVQGIGDFNGDGKADILWKHANGTVFVWLMNGAAIASTGSPTTVTDAGWAVQGIGDFDGNGKADVLWKHGPSGTVLVWLMNGTAIGASASPGTVDSAAWAVEGVADFDGDGKADILWKHAPTGTTFVWLMNGGTIGTTGSPATVGNDGWEVKGVGDYDGDGRADVFWRHAASGTTFVWRMNGASVIGTGSPATVDDPNWQVQNPR